jgi:hypothetical protein
VVLLMLFVTGRGVFAQETMDTQTPQPVSTAHTLFGKQCGLCHEPFRGAPEQLCLKCHAGPLHTVNQATTPACIACHVEHRGRERLADVANEQCVTCHADVQVKEGKAALFAKKVTGFAADHPEFAVTIKDTPTLQRMRLAESQGRRSDPTTLTFSHEAHLKPDLKSPKGKVQLACKDCHAPAADGNLIEPIVYEQRCQSCHALEFSPDFPGRVVPHVEPIAVHGFLVGTFAERRSAPPPSPPPMAAPSRLFGRLTRPVPSVAPIITTPTPGQSVTAAEKHLFSVTCNKCHVVTKGQGRFPVIERVAIHEIWFPHARFSHRSHRLLECTSCHVDVAKSQTATDVLLPGITVCRQCHRTGSETAKANLVHSATTKCVSCHNYHDKSMDVDWNGSFSVQQVLTEGESKKGKKR